MHTATQKRRGLSLIELLAAVTILGIVAAIIVPRFRGHREKAEPAACFVNQGNIEVQTQLWRRQKGRLPAADLSDIGGDGAYFPDGLPRCPVDGSAYQIDATTGRVVGHAHP